MLQILIVLKQENKIGYLVIEKYLTFTRQHMIQKRHNNPLTLLRVKNFEHVPEKAIFLQTIKCWRKHKIIPKTKLIGNITIHVKMLLHQD